MRLAPGLRQAASLPQSRAEIRRSKPRSDSPCWLLGSPARLLWFRSSLGDSWVCFGVQTGWGHGSKPEKRNCSQEREREREGVQWEPLKALNLARSLPIPENEYLRGAGNQLPWEIKK